MTEAELAQRMVQARTTTATATTSSTAPKAANARHDESPGCPMFSSCQQNDGRIDDRGSRLQPPRHIVWITPAQAATLDHASGLVLRLDADVLASECLALVSF